MTRDDLPCSYIAPQVAHATADYALRYPDTFARWRTESQRIIVVSVPGPDELYPLCAKLHGAVPFIEPDLGFSMTAFAVIPSPEQRKHLKRLPLAVGAHSTDLSTIRESRAAYAHLDLDWTPRPTWEQDRRDFHSHIKENHA